MAFLLIILEDYLGRKKVILGSYLFLLIWSICTCLVDNFKTKVVGITILWSFVEVLYSSLFMLFNELSVHNFRDKSNMLFILMYNIGGMIGTVSSSFTSDYKSIVYIFVATYSIMSFMVFIFIPESPYLLVKLRKYTDLRKSFLQMCKSNKLTSLQIKSILSNIDTLIESRDLMNRWRSFSKQNSRKKQ